ncbi:segregation and condensation protein A [Caldinitratiruptor microaerophilus]|uniref:Segregation and condensation protein A n=1 Tax=Caldinitratiruptor microaerophilus TaxID=671077 RepID=A0AA35CMD8_9FIRM|nr:segregation/condensation protein A [Caldinitratiruptor microaerophilus]BDG59965.1 segregation and condensation protein A [Caldinitratiruptor microaerophilus]
MNGIAPGAGRDLTVRLENFEGPLDLLLYLIRKEEVSIHDIPIARIAEQYLAYIADLSDVEIDRAADFLVMAATLLDIKARMLLPRPPRPEGEAGAEDGEDEDPRAELARQLEAYQRFKELAAELRRREEAAGRSYPRGWYPEAPRGPAPLVGVSLADLVAAFRALLEERGAWREVPRETVTLRDKLREILQRLGRSPAGVPFRSLFRPGAGRLEILVTFLALLELVRQQRARAVQERPFAEILILPAPQGQGGIDGA